jgi:hypothetical protein
MHAAVAGGTELSQSVKVGLEAVGVDEEGHERSREADDGVIIT